MKNLSIIFNLLYWEDGVSLTFFMAVIAVNFAVNR